MNKRPPALLVAAIVAFAGLVLASAARFGLNFEESVAYAPCRLDIVASIDAREDPPSARYTDQRKEDRPPPPERAHLVPSTTLPRLALEAPGGLWLPLLNQIYMTNHLALAGAAIARVTDPALGPRIFHALLGIFSLLLLYDVGAEWLTKRARLFAVALASVSATFTFMFTWARFDESLPSVSSLATLACVLRYRREERLRWLVLAALSAALGISAKLTTLWPLAAMALAAFVAQNSTAHRVTRLSGRLLRHLSVALPLALLGFIPLIVNGLLHPASPTGSEVSRRIAFVPQIVTTPALPRALMNALLYLGGWGSLLRGLVLGKDEAIDSVTSALLIAPGCALVVATFFFLLFRAIRSRPSEAADDPESTPRRARPEASLLIFFGSIWLLVALFYNEHMDYQFVLVVPLIWLGPGTMLDALASRLQKRKTPAKLAVAVVLLPFLLASLIEQGRLLSAIDHAKSPMMDLRVQRASAEYLMDKDITRPIETTFHATGVYEQLSRCALRPLHVFKIFRDRKLSPAGLRHAWAHILSLHSEAPIYVLLPLGQNPVEARHFDERAIRQALLDEAGRAHGGAELVRTFTSQAGDPLIEIYRIQPRAKGERDPRLGLEPPERWRSAPRSAH